MAMLRIVVSKHDRHHPGEQDHREL